MRSQKRHSPTITVVFRTGGIPHRRPGRINAYRICIMQNDVCTSRIFTEVVVFAVEDLEWLLDNLGAGGNKLCRQVKRGDIHPVRELSYKLEMGH